MTASSGPQFNLYEKRQGHPGRPGSLEGGKKSCQETAAVIRTDHEAGKSVMLRPRRFAREPRELTAGL